MALQSLNFWEVAIDATQIGLCGLIVLFLIRNHIKFKQMTLNAPFEKKSQNFNTEFVIEAIRQQTELAFNHISETIDKERQTLHAYFELRETQLAPGLLTSAESDRIESCFSSEPSKADATCAIYNEIDLKTQKSACRNGQTKRFIYLLLIQKSSKIPGLEVQGWRR